MRIVIKDQDGDEYSISLARDAADARQLVAQWMVHILSEVYPVMPTHRPHTFTVEIR